MPSTVTGLLDAVGLQWEGSVAWGTSVPQAAPGVYIVSRCREPSAEAEADGGSVISTSAVAELLEVRPELRLDGARPDVAALADRLQAFWLPNEPVVYIGMAGTSIRTRVRQYYVTPLGAAKPHAGGWFLKTLAGIDALWVHYAATPTPKGAEHQLLASFREGVDAAERGRLHDPERALPFANLEWPKGTSKRHGITGARAPRPSADGRASVASEPSEVRAAGGVRSAAGGRERGGHETQPVTAVDAAARRVRLPPGSKVLLPTDKAYLEVHRSGNCVRARGTLGSDLASRARARSPSDGSCWPMSLSMSAWRFMSTKGAECTRQNPRGLSLHLGAPLGVRSGLTDLRGGHCAFASRAQRSDRKPRPPCGGLVERRLLVLGSPDHPR